MIYYANTDLLKVAFYESGEKDKPVVLLLHGWPDDATTWDAVAPQFVQAGYRIIAPYLRAYRDAGRRPFSITRGTPGIGHSPGSFFNPERVT